MPRKSYTHHNSDEERREAIKGCLKESYEKNKERYQLMMKKNQINRMILKIKNNEYVRVPKYSLEELNTKLEQLNMLIYSN